MKRLLYTHTTSTWNSWFLIVIRCSRRPPGVDIEGDDVYLAGFSSWSGHIISYQIKTGNTKHTTAIFGGTRNHAFPENFSPLFQDVAWFDQLNYFSDHDTIWMELRGAYCSLLGQRCRSARSYPDLGPVIAMFVVGAWRSLSSWWDKMGKWEMQMTVWIGNTHTHTHIFGHCSIRSQNWDSSAWFPTTHSQWSYNYCSICTVCIR